MLFVFFSVLTLALMVQTQLEGKTSESLAHIRTVPISCSSSPHIRHGHTRAEARPGGRMSIQTPVTLTHFFEEVKLIL